jgi:hypothetical protein
MDLGQLQNSKKNLVIAPSEQRVIFKIELGSRRRKLRWATGGFKEKWEAPTLCDDRLERR